MCSIYMLCDRVVFCGFGEAGPAATRIEFGGGIEQFGIAADAVVCAIFPMGFIFSGERTLSGGMARHLQGARFGIFFLEQRLPLGIGFLNGMAHDEQLMEMVDAQSGGKSA